MRLGKRSKSIAQVLIDLTPLLDVIFILLIVVLSYQDNFNKAAEEQLTYAVDYIDDANDKVAAADARVDTAEEQVENYAKLNDYVNVITINASYKPSNRKYRVIHVAVNADDMREIPLNPSNTNEAWKECKVYVEQIISDGKPTILSIKNEKMLYRDEESIMKMYEELNASTSNVYLKPNERKADE